MRKITIAVGFLFVFLLATTPASAQGNPPALEIAFTGYYLRTYVPSGSSTSSGSSAGIEAYSHSGGYTGTSNVFNQENFNQFGFGVQVAGPVNNWFAVVGEYDYYMGCPFSDQNFTLKTTGHFYGAGPGVYVRPNEKIVPSFKSLVGGYTLKAKAEFDGQEIGRDSETGFGIKSGMDVDFYLTERVAFRTGFHHLGVRVSDQWVNNLSVTFGFNFTFGSR